MKILIDNINSVENYDKMIDSSVNGTCFAYSWFLKLKGTNSIIKVLNEKNELIAIMPLFLSEDKKSICQSTMYIPYGGPVLLSLPKERRNQIRTIRMIENQLSLFLKDNFDNFCFSMDYYIEDIMPFIRNGIIPELRYTYVINLDDSIDIIYNNFGNDRKKEIRRCAKNNIEFYLDNDLKYFSCEKCVEWEKKYNFPSSKLFVKKFIIESIKRKKGMCFVAKVNDEVYGAVYIVWDKKSAYILYSYFDHSKEKDLGVISFLYYNIFKYLKEINIKRIDFEGSVYESVENYNISFGAYQCRYYNLHYSKNNKIDIFNNLYCYYEK